ASPPSNTPRLSHVSGFFAGMELLLTAPGHHHHHHHHQQRQRAITDFFNRSGGFTQEKDEAVNTHPIIYTTQPTLDNAAQTAASPLDQARAHTVADFSTRLHSFAALGIPKHGWDRVGPQHPILAIVGVQMRCESPVEITSHGAERADQ
ncbi:hypothetical protein Vretifemale_17702, partial [Volvox reticuliferus]